MSDRNNPASATLIFWPLPVCHAGAMRPGDAGDFVRAAEKVNYFLCWFHDLECSGNSSCAQQKCSGLITSVAFLFFETIDPPSLSAPTNGLRTGQDIFNHGIARISVTWINRCPSATDSSASGSNQMAQTLSKGELIAFHNRSGLMFWLPLSSCQHSGG